MDHHIDIDVRPEPNFPDHQIMAALYGHLHRVLVAQKSSRIGVSFPDFCLRPPHLGTRLRLHGDFAVLSTLMASDWLVGVRDHILVAQIARIPETFKHCMVRRVQVKSSPERLRRRLMRRHQIDREEAHKRIPYEAGSLTNLPFVQLRSTSTGQNFRLFIEQGPVQDHAIDGNFNTYGLSQGATIPWF